MILAALLISLAPQEAPLAVDLDAKQRARILRFSPLPAPPADPTNAVADDPRAARLGQFLFYDPRLSSNGEVSCATCHVPERAFTDGLPVAETLARGSRNVPTVLNAAYDRWFFWDGRADSLWAQALFPIEDPREMGGSRVDVARLVASDDELRAAFEEVFGPLGDDVDRTFANVGKALEAYERKLVARRAPFDVFVEGLRENDAEKLRALTPSAQRGLVLFTGKARCWQCHHGPTFSDLEFHNILVPPLEEDRPFDPGRQAGVEVLRASPFNGVGPFSDDRTDAEFKVGYLKTQPEDYGAFKTPSLRNVAATAPYMHQGQFADLERVLEYYSTLEGAVEPRGHREQILVPLKLSPEERADLIAFLESLTDLAVDESLLRRPESPRLP